MTSKMKTIVWCATLFTFIVTGCSDQSVTYYKNGKAKAELKDYKGAIDEYTKAIEVNPKYALAYRGRGAAKVQLDDYSGAITDFTKAIEIDPNDTFSYWDRGVAKGAVDDYNGAIVDLTKVIAINPHADSAYELRGEARMAQKNYDGAIVDCDRAIEINPQDENAYFLRGNAKAQLNKNREALDDYNKAIEINPQNAEAYYNRGAVKHNLGDESSAIEDFNKSTELKEKKEGADGKTGRGGKVADNKGPGSSQGDVTDSKSLPQSEPAGDGLAKHDLSSIPGCYALRFHKYETPSTVLYLRKDGKVMYVIHQNSSTEIKMLNGSYTVNGTDIFVVHEIGSFHVQKQHNGSLVTGDGLILEQDYSY